MDLADLVPMFRSIWSLSISPSFAYVGYFLADVC